MRGERGVLRLGEFLVGRASRRLPRAAREERYREWVAELPAILHDPGTRPGWLRAARMLGYAADTLRAAALARRRGHRAGPAWLPAVGNSRGLLALVAVEMSLQAVVVYLVIFGTRLEVCAAMWATAIAALTYYLFARRARSVSLAGPSPGRAVPPSSTPSGIAFDCADAAALARFWAGVLGRQVAEGATSERAVLLADIEGNEFGLIAR